MSINYEALETIKDSLYRKVCGGAGGLSDSLKAAKFNMEAYPVTSLQASGKAAETITRFIYVKYVSTNTKDANGNEISANDMAKDNTFKATLDNWFGAYEGNITFEDLAKIRRYRNAGAHNNKDTYISKIIEKDPVGTAKGIFAAAISIIEKILAKVYPGSIQLRESSVTDTFSDAPKSALPLFLGAVTIQREMRPNKEGYKYSLKAHVVLDEKLIAEHPEFGNLGEDSFVYTWIREGEDRPAYRPQSRPLFYFGQQEEEIVANHQALKIQCKVTCSRMTDSIVSEYYPITQDDLIRDYSATVSEKKNQYQKNNTILQEDPSKNTEHTDKPALQGSITIQKIPPTASNPDKLTLKAEVEGLNNGLDRKALKYRWGCKRPDSAEHYWFMTDQPGKPPVRPTLSCRKAESLGNTYYVEARCDGYSGFLADHGEPLTEADYAISPAGDKLQNGSAGLQSDAPPKRTKIIEALGSAALNTITENSPLRGNLIVKIDSSKTTAAGAKLEAELSNANFQLQDDGVKLTWYVLNDDGDPQELFNAPGAKKSFFVCEKDLSLGKRYRCKVTYGSYENFEDSPILQEEHYAIRATVTVKPKLSKDENSVPIMTLKTAVTESNYQGQPVYEWYRNGVKIDSNEQATAITKEDIGASFVCTISHPGLIGQISSIARTVEAVDFLKLDEKLASAEISAAEINTPSLNDSVSSDPSPSAEMAVTPPTEEDVPVSKDDPKEQETKKSSGLSLTEKPAGVVAPEFKCFYSDKKGPHYFVANRDDYYATNALECLDYNAFLYALLKEQGYQRVIIVGNHSEGESVNFPVIAYDLVSQVSFLKPKDFADRLSEEESKDYATLIRISTEINGKPVESIRGPAGGRSRKVSEKSADKSALFGKRVITTIHRGTGTGKQNFDDFILRGVAPALESDIVKTAIVLPLELFSDKNNVWDREKDTYRYAVLKLQDALAHSGSSKLIITADQEDDFQNLFKDPDQSISKAFGEIDSAFNSANVEIQGTNNALAYSNAFVSALINEGRIQIATQAPGIDEVANLLMIKKLQDPKKYAGLPASKVYSLAELLVTKCSNSENTRKTLPSIRNNTWSAQSLRSLSVNALEDNTVVAPLIAIAKDLWPRSIVPVSNLKSTYVERIYACANRVEGVAGVLPLERAVISAEERQAENDAAMEELNKMIGLKSVKKMLRGRFAVASNNVAKGPGHYIFSGNPGTGKTVVARLIGEILRSQGLLRKGHWVEAAKSDLVSNHVGESALFTRKKCEEALDGVLFIDEAYQLVNTERTTEAKFSSSFDEEAYTTLLAFMENNRSRLCVICAGYPAQMEAFRNANPGMARRIPKKNIINFPDYSADELCEILTLMINEEKLAATASFKEAAESAIAQMWNNRNSEFGNAGDVRNFLEECVDKASLRKVDNQLPSLELSAEDIPSEYTCENLSHEELIKLQASSMEKLNELVGLTNVKQQLKKLFKEQRRAQKAGNKIFPGHYLFSGNSGTGKTEVAKLFGKILTSHGILRKGHTVRVKAPDLVAGYVGQTGVKTENILKEALDGVLFVDEAYSLVDTSTHSSAGDFGGGAYTQIMDYMEEHRDRICVIFAGYPKQMDDFLKFNPGMSSRIPYVIQFDDYSDDELVQIMRVFEKEENQKRYPAQMSDEFVEATRKVIPAMRNKSDFGNARDIRTYFKACRENASDRIPENEDVIIMPEDIPEEYQGYLSLVSGTSTVPAPQTEKAKPADANPIQSLSLLPRSLFENLPDPYQNLDVHSTSAFQPYCLSATARIETEHGTATAFVVTPDGYAITCAHSVAEKEKLYNLAHKKLKARLPDSQEFSFHIVNTKPDIDMALIKIDAPYPLPYLKIADEERAVIIGEEWALFGYPFGSEHIMRFSGSIASREERGKAGENGYIHYIDGDAKPGDSGGPIIAKTDGCVIGILRGALGESEQALQNYMKPIKYFWKEFLK